MGTALVGGWVEGVLSKDRPPTTVRLLRQNLQPLRCSLHRGEPRRTVSAPFAPSRLLGCAASQGPPSSPFGAGPPQQWVSRKKAEKCYFFQNLQAKKRFILFLRWINSSADVKWLPLWNSLLFSFQVEFCSDSWLVLLCSPLKVSEILPLSHALKVPLVFPGGSGEAFTLWGTGWAYSVSTCFLWF